MSYSEIFYIAVTQFQDFETSIAGLFKQALIYESSDIKLPIIF
jgi:4-hydroxyphenylpyruvate dioxygenase-like putative hemolysin